MSGEVNIECGDTVDISTVSEMYKQLNAALDEDGPIVLNAGAIERIDTAALQMFACFFQEVKSRSRDISWKAPSEALLRSANYLGLKPTLLLTE